LTEKVKREEKRIQKTRMQETEWLPNNGFWMPEIPENQSRKHEKLKAGRRWESVEGQGREYWKNGIMGC
jgi:hypothetical protein